MINGLIILVAIAGSMTIQAYKIDPSWAVLSVPNPPAGQSDDDSDYTWVTDSQGNVTRVHNDDAPKAPAPYFAAKDDVRFELFTQSNPTEAHLLVLENSTTVENSHFNPKNPTRIFVHGWNSQGLLTPRFAKAYLVDGKHNVNFIALNWQKGSDTMNYFAARGRVEEVGHHLAKFIDFLAEKHQLKIQKDLHIIGHSLGAHISGIAGKSVTKGKVAKIVGLDPASPRFKFEDVEGRLDETDAFYVEVIHTCAGTLGFDKPIGTASFYPNGGSSQPGCSGWDFGMCSHGRSYEYFLESLVRPRFVAFQCESFEDVKDRKCTVVSDLIKMGEEPGRKYTEGIYYLETNPDSLYSQGANGVWTTLAKTNEAKFSLLSNEPSTKFMELVNRKLKQLEETEKSSLE